MDSPVIHDGGVGSHAQTSSPSAAAGQSPTNYRQIGTRKGNGRLLLGAAHSYHASSVAAVAGADAASSLAGSVPSIPSRFETVLYAGDQEPDAFLSRCTRFKHVVADLPGPGAYAGDIVSSNPAIKSASTSFSTKGYGVGFVSQAKRFKRKGGGPSPGQYNDHTNMIATRVGSAPNRGASYSATAAFRPSTHGALDPSRSTMVTNANAPAPGSYKPVKTVVLTASVQRKLAAKGMLGSSGGGSQSSLAAAFQSSLLSPQAKEAAFSSKDARFRHEKTTAEALGAGPAGYMPEASFAALHSSSHAAKSVFSSHTKRTDFAGAKADVPGPGYYSTSTEEKEPAGASSSSDARSVSPSRAFRPTGLDRFGHVLEPKITREVLPGPGSYDVNEKPIPVKAKHPPPNPASPLAASLSHGLPIARAGDDSPTRDAKSVRRKKRAAGAGGPGQSLLATRGGPGVALNSPAHLLHPASPGTFGRAGHLQSALSPAAIAQAGQINAPSLVAKESEIRPPGPAFYKPDEAFHHVRDKKAFHLNSASRWM